MVNHSVPADPCENILSRLSGVRRSGSHWMARCPAHDDHTPSLSIAAGDDGRVLVTCFAGCETERVVAKLGLHMSDLFPADPELGSRNRRGPKAATQASEDSQVRPPKRPVRERRFPIADASGRVVAVHVRRDFDDGSKDLPWERPDGRSGLAGLSSTDMPLYGIHERRPGQTTIVVEGEPAREALVPLAAQLDVAVVATVTGAKATPGDEALRPLLDSPIVLWPDSDGPGESHMDRLHWRLRELGQPKDAIRRIAWSGARPGQGDDGADFVAGGGTSEALRDLVEGAAEWSGSGVSTDARTRRVTAAGDTFDRIAPVEIEWLWPDVLARGFVAEISGDPGIGKSLLTAEIAAAVSTGRALPGGEPTDPAGVVLVSYEDHPAAVVRGRLEAAGADLSRVFALTGVREGEGDERDAILPADLDALRDGMARVNAKLVVIDPLLTAVDRQFDSHKDADTKQALRPLTTLAQETGAALLFVRHLSKTGGRAVTRPGGSVGLTGTARLSSLVAVDPDDPERRLLLPIKSNLGRQHPAWAFRILADGSGAPPRIAWDPEARTVTADDVLAHEHDEPEERSAVTEAIEWLRGYLGDGPQPADGVYAQARKDGIAERTLKRAKAKMGVASRREGASWVWVPPEKNASQTRGTDVGLLGPLGTLHENRPDDEETPPSQRGHTTQEGQAGHVPARGILAGAMAGANGRAPVEEGDMWIALEERF
jgi:putative DNA primase/helicase